MGDLRATRVLLIDECPLVRAGLKATLEAVGMTVVGETDDERTALTVARNEPLDVVVLDVASSSYDGVALLRELAACTRAKLLVLSAFGGRAREAFAAGAHGFALKNDPVESVVQTLDAVVRNGGGVSPSALARLDPLQHLTARERQIFTMVIDGLSTERIAATLSISAKTVESHRASMNRKLGVHSSADVVRFAAECGLLAPRTKRWPDGERARPA